MRPAKRILLAGVDEDRLSILRFVLRNSSYSKSYCLYHVDTANSEEDVLKFLSKERYHLLLCLHPMASLDSILTDAMSIDNGLKTMVIATKASEIDSPRTDALLFDPSAAEILERIKVLMYRKRGPMKGMKRKVASEKNKMGEEKAA